MTSKPRPRLKEEAYDVGYGRPPKHGQFKPGQSGNPRGRPKPQPTVEQTIKEVLLSKRKVLVNGRPQTKTTLELVLMQLVDAALKKDTRATRLLMDLQKFAAARTPDEPAGEEASFELDMKILRDYAARLTEGKPG